MASAKFEITRECKCCGTSFLAKTITSIYCSPKCSKKAYAENKRQEKIEKLKIEKAKTIPNDQEFISVSDAVCLYDVSRDTLYRLVRKEKIQSYNLGKRLTKICRSDIEKKFNLIPLTNSQAKKRKEVKTYRLEKEDCYTIGEISKIFGISETSVYNHIRKYSIPTRQIGNYVYAPKNEIDKLYKG